METLRDWKACAEKLALAAISSPISNLPGRPDTPPGSQPEWDPDHTWEPKAVRLGLSCGLLVRTRTGISFSDRFRSTLGAHGREWATTERATFLRDGLKTLLVVAAARSTFDDQGVVPLYEDEATYLFSQVPYRAALHLISIGTRVDVFVVTGDSFHLTNLGAEFFDAVAVKASDVGRRSQIRPFTMDLCIGLVEARIIVHDPSLLDYTHILGLFLYNHFDSHGLIDEMESFFPVDVTGERRASNKRLNPSAGAGPAHIK